MKTFIQNLFNSLAISAVMSVSALAETPSATNQPAKKFEVGMYQINQTAKLNLSISKVSGQRVKITLQNARGQVLHSETLGKKATRYSRKFNFEDMEQGAYLFQITNGENTIAKEVNLKTPEMIEVRPEMLISQK